MSSTFSPRVEALAEAYQQLEPLGETPFEDNGVDWGLRQDIATLKGLLKADPAWAEMLKYPIGFACRKPDYVDTTEWRFATLFIDDETDWFGRD